MNLSSLRVKAKVKSKMLFGTSWISAQNEEVCRFLTKSSLAKFAKRSKKFAALAETTNNSVVFEKQKNTSKSYSLKQS